MIIEQSDLCNFADNNISYSCGAKLTEITKKLIFHTKSFLNWLKLNSLKANLEKCQFIILGDKSHHKHILKINSLHVEASDDLLLPRITIDNKTT